MHLDYNIELISQNPDPNNTLSSTLHYHKLAAQRNEKAKNGQRSAWQPLNKAIDDCFKNKAEVIKKFYEEAFETPQIEIGKLLPYSFVIQFRFSLAQPYISRDEADFYIIDNPVRKDKVFGLPYVAPTSWKGSLRAALYKLGYQAQNEQIKRLFGNDKDVEKPEDLQAGRIYFFPTFFTQKSLEIINPHDRKRRVGKNPILIESVPAGAEGVFTLLYVPFNPHALKENETLARQVADDLLLVAEALRAMLYEYGFGAKTSSGFGLAENSVQNLSKEKKSYIELNLPDRSDSSKTIPQPEPPAEPESVKQIHAMYPDEDFSLKPDLWREKHKASSSQRAVYVEAREQLRGYNKAFQDYQTKLAEYEMQKNVLPPATIWREFANFEELKKHVEAWKAQVQ